MNLIRPKIIFTTAALAAGFGIVFILSGFLERSRPASPEGIEDADLAVQGKKLKGFVLGADGLLADWYWIQSLQYLGDKIDKGESEFLNLEDLSSINPRLLYPYLDNATEFDPHFLPPYSFGATVLPAVNKEKAIALTEKGIANNPDKFRLYQYLGYIYWRLGRYAEASEVYKRGARLPDAPPFMKLMAAAMTSEGGSRETARAMYQQVYDEAEDQQTKNNAEYRLMDIDLKPELDVINDALKSYQKKNGRCKSSLSEVASILAGSSLANGADFRVNASRELVDTVGIPYAFDPENCQVAINPQRRSTEAK